MAKESLISKKSGKESFVGILKTPNDFRLGPIKRFRLSEVTKILKERTDAAFEGLFEYDFDDMSTVSKFLTTDILSACNDLKWPAFKIVVSVKILQNMAQTARGSLRYYWNATDDGLAHYCYDTVNYKVLVTAAFIYFE